MEVGDFAYIAETEKSFDEAVVSVLKAVDQKGWSLFQEGLQSEKFNTQRTIGAFKKRGGILLACGTCLKIRDKEESGICSVSTMDDMLNLVVESDKVMTFG